MVEYSSHTNLHDSQAMYHRLIQPVYERSVIKHVYDNKISLKSGATAQLLSKRPKTTGMHDVRKEHVVVFYNDARYLILFQTVLFFVCLTCQAYCYNRQWPLCMGMN